VQCAGQPCATHRPRAIGRRQSQGGDRESERAGNVHERGFSRRDRAFSFRNDHYPSQEAYLFAIAEAMRHEYETVAKPASFCRSTAPTFGMGRHIQYADSFAAEFKKKARLHIEALNHALANIPPEQLRLHLCWATTRAPSLRRAARRYHRHRLHGRRPSAHFPGSRQPAPRPRVEGVRDGEAPEGKLLIPGVLESKTNFIEHPELIAQRIGRYAKLVGRENVIAGSDCGYGTWVGQAAVDPDVVWAKMAAMAEGARIATKEFWR